MAITTEQLNFIINIMAKYDGLEDFASKVNSTFAGLQAQSKATGVSVQDLHNSFVKTGKYVKDFGDGAELAVQGVQNRIDQTKKSTQGLAQGFNVIRSAMGFMLAAFMGEVLNGIRAGLQKIIESASQLEQAFIRIGIAEKAMSARGIDITPKQLTDIAERVSNAYATVSNIDAMKMVSNLAVLTKDLKLTADQYDKLAMTIPLVAMQAGVSIDSATDQVITGLTKSGRGWADLGITVDAAIIRQKALEMQLVASAEAYQNLTAEQKQQVEVLALLEILEENTVDNKAAQEKYNNTLEGSQKALNSQLEDFAAALGKAAAPTIIDFLHELTESLKILNTWLEDNTELVEELSLQFAALSKTYRAATQLGGGNPAAGLLALQGSVGVSEYYKSAYEDAKKIQDDLKNLTDTPTASKPKVEIDPDVDMQGKEGVEKAFDELKNDIEDENKKLENDKFEAKIDLDIKLEDINIDYGRKVADIIKDYNRNIADINEKYSSKVSDIKSETRQAQAEAEAKYRNDELKAEQEYQNKLLKMREDYLMDLEEALHERDARQILRLMKKYELDKTQAARDHALDSQQRKMDYQQEMADVKAQEAQKLAEAQKEHQQELDDAKEKRDEDLADAAEKRQQDIEDAQRDYQRKLADLQRHYQQRLQALANTLRQEYQLTAQQAQALAKMLGGDLNAYRQYAQSLASATVAAQQQMNAGIATTTSRSIAGISAGASGVSRSTSTSIAGISAGAAPKPAKTTTTSYYSGITGGATGRYAEGGTVLANKPTRAIFGENGLEMATFMPLGRIGKNVNKIFGSGLAGAGGGNITIALDLSPDLEGRIIANTLDETANIMLRTRRSK